MTEQKPMNEPQILTDLITRKQPIVAMIAPSFPIVYEYPDIIGKLKRLGFNHVLEVSAGAMKTNAAALEILKNDPKARIITSPCASFVRMIRTKYPHLKEYLGFAADSPMVATARMVLEKYPDHRPIFIGPCNAKKLEASEDYPELGIVSVTFEQMKPIFDHFKIIDDPADKQAKFDIEESKTRLYPISGGLAQSSEARDLLADEEIEVVSGWQNCEKALKRFQENDRVRLLDILFCEGGCISGPGIVSDLDINQRREKVVEFWKSTNEQQPQIKKNNFLNKIKETLMGLIKT
jgi:iron only hydrogenase large subunit-like protein